jgi:predicted nucleic acid-binding protein
VNVLIDTPIWSLALRRKPADLSAPEHALVERFTELIREGRIEILGIIRQEVLSGIRDEERGRKIRESLRAFEDAIPETADYEEAAHMHNVCRSRGVAGSAIDLLLCAVAHRRNWHVFTADRDFEHYARILGISLFE